MRLAAGAAVAVLEREAVATATEGSAAAGWARAAAGLARVAAATATEGSAVAGLARVVVATVATVAEIHCRWRPQAPRHSL